MDEAQSKQMADKRKLEINYSVFKDYNFEGRFKLDNGRQEVAVATNRKRGNAVAIRQRAGTSASHSEWLNELQVYLLPNFNSPNILEFIGADKRRDWNILSELASSSGQPQETPLSSRPQPQPQPEPQPEQSDSSEKFLDARSSNPRDSTSPEMKTATDEESRVTDQSVTGKENDEKDASKLVSRRAERIKFVILNDFSGCVTLRQFLRDQTISWAQLMSISVGIISGLHYLHENAEYNQLDTHKAINGFVKSTNGAIKSVSFASARNIIHMKPVPALSIIHRNLTSENVVIRGGYQACIWNFGLSYVHHPFQPTNHEQLIHEQIKEEHLNSPYSPPEVLIGKGHMSIASMKSIDMYACGMLFWELISRCQLPPIEELNDEEHHERIHPDEYSAPFEKEFGDEASKAMLFHVVCKLRARPRIKSGWLAGRKSGRFVQTMLDLWDHDFDARLHTSTVFDRFKLLDRKNQDSACKHSKRHHKVFDRHSMWPLDFSYASHSFGMISKCAPNIIFENNDSDSFTHESRGYSYHTVHHRYRQASPEPRPSTSRAAGIQPETIQMRTRISPIRLPIRK